MSEPISEFQIEWHGDAIVVIPPREIESLNWDVIPHLTDSVMAPIKQQKVPLVVVDLSETGYFGSVFLALLLRCDKAVKEQSGEFVLCGAHQMARALLSLTRLDTLWAVYDTRQQALEAIGA